MHEANLLQCSPSFLPSFPSRSFPSLPSLPPSLPLRVVGGVGSLRLPPWGGEHGACLMDYVPLVHRLLTEKVETIVQSYVRRKEYVAALLSVIGRSVLEYDTESFKKVAFLFEQQGFSFVAHCELAELVQV